MIYYGHGIIVFQKRVGKEMTTRKSRTAFGIGVLMLLTAAVLFVSLAQPVWAANGEDNDPTGKKEIYKDITEGEGQENQGEGHGVHANPATFQKNFDLTVEQKEYTIKAIEDVVKFCTRTEMSDLQKYYELGKWANQRVVYDNEFWDGKYNMEYYSHQWDAYGCINEDEKSVCAGIAVFYSNLCHAADLPCKFVRLNPKMLDHTITYIPDINGHAYYADITENDFLMSKETCGFALDADLGFSGITDENADDGSFEYREDGDTKASNIKDCWQEKKTYKDWFNEYTWNEETDKEFVSKYDEKGSGTYGEHYASYREFEKYLPQPYFTSYASTDDNELLRTNDELTDNWFLNDFYKHPKATENKIINRKFDDGSDDQVLKVTGVKSNYDLNNEDAIAAAVKETLSVEYFPSYKDGEIVAETTALTSDDYEVTCEIKSEHEATITITGRGAYSGTYTMPVNLYTVSVAQEPIKKKNLVYNGSAQKLVKDGKAENEDTMQIEYALGTKDAATGEFSEDIPTGVNAGAYYVWYKAVSKDGSRADSKPQCLKGPVRIDPKDVQMTVGSYTIGVGETVKISAKLSENIPVTYTFENDDPSVTTVSDTGVVKGKGVGYSGIYVYAYPADGNSNYDIDSACSEVNVVKGTNPIKLKGKTVTIKAKDLKKKAKTIKRAKAIKVSKQKGKLSFKLVSAKKGGKNFKSKFKINAKTGKVTVKKGLAKGTYKVTVKVKAKGNSNYKASKWKKVTFKVKVK